MCDFFVSTGFEKGGDGRIFEIRVTAEVEALMAQNITKMTVSITRNGKFVRLGPNEELQPQTVLFVNYVTEVQLGVPTLCKRLAVAVFERCLPRDGEYKATVILSDGQRKVVPICN